MSILTCEQWILEQFSSCNLGDLRRTERLVKVAHAMVDKPDASLPEQNEKWSATKAAYRLFDSSSVTFDAVAGKHWEQTKKQATGRCVLISDTTDIDLYSHQATAGLGILGDGKGRGIQLHSCLAYDSREGQILGLAGSQLHYRKHVSKGETRNQVLKRKRESERWGDVVEQVGRPPSGSQWIHVFDRGGDNFEAFCRILQQGCDWVIRAAKLNRYVLLESGERLSLKDAIGHADYLGGYELELRSRPGVSARTATIEVLSKPIVMPLPRRQSPWLQDAGIDSIKMNVVIVREVNAPAGKKPIQWVLLTSLPATTFKQAWQVIEDYESRWLIEEYHKVLKTGCNVEAHALRSADRLEPLIGLITVIGTRLLQLKLVGRQQRQAKARDHVPAQWLDCLGRYKPKLAIGQLTVYEFFRELAKLGGFLARRSDGEPGWQTTWRGYQKLTSLIEGLSLAKRKCG